MATSNNKGINWKQVFNLIAYIAVVLIGIALILGKLISSMSALEEVGKVLAYIVTAFCAFFYAWKKRNRQNGWVWLVFWAIGVVMIIISYVL